MHYMSELHLPTDAEYDERLKRLRVEHVFCQKCGGRMRLVEDKAWNQFNRCTGEKTTRFMKHWRCNKYEPPPPYSEVVGHDSEFVGSRDEGAPME